MANILRLCSEIAQAGGEISPSEVIKYFTSIPYENATKRARGRFESKQAEVEALAENFLNGVGGGTCFPFAEALVQVLAAFKIPAHPVLCDRSYGRAVHCGVLADFGGKPLWLDPGYLVNKPIPLYEGGMVIDNGFNDIKLVHDAGIVRVFTIEAGSERLRYWFKPAPTVRSEFEAAWEDSYKWEMMNYVVATRRTADKQYYLRKNALIEKSRGGVKPIPFDRIVAGKVLRIDPVLL